MSANVRTPSAGNPQDVRADVVRPKRDGREWLVPAWLKGMRDATGEDAAWSSGAQSPRPLSQLAVVLEGKAPAEPADRCAWARGVAKEYAEARKGVTLSVLAFCDWMGSGKPPKANGANGKAWVQPVPPGGSRWKAGDGYVHPKAGDGT